jgi:hypothetical protein
MSDERLAKAQSDAEDSVAAWLLTLELARLRGDFSKAADAQRELARRGVIVRYTNPPQQRQEACHVG